MSSNSKFLLIGLQEAGKTTFLAALWYLVQPNRHATALRLDKLEGSSKYLNRILKDWLEYKKVPRTYSASEQVVSMRLKDQQSDLKMTLHFPDLAGESFEDQWASRQWTRDYQKILETSAGGILFINPDTVKNGVRIDQVDAILQSSGQEEIFDEEQAAGEIPLWDKKTSPTQVQLVEILQFIRDSKIAIVPFRLAVVVSAWDRVNITTLLPSAWLKDKLPLLSQFLQTNASTFECEIFGISAQGGEYAALPDGGRPDNHLEPLSAIDPVKRIKVVGERIVDENDITLPLKWMMR